MSEILAVLAGIIGILFGAVTVQSKRAADYKKKTKELEYSKDIQENITDIVLNHSKQTNEFTDTFKNGSDGIIKKLIILLCFSFLFSACSYYSPNAPKLYLIDKPKDFTDIEYIYQGDLYCFDEAGMKELLRQLDWCSNAVTTYEKQIELYNKFLKGIK